MSSVYNTEPPTSGKVILVTNYGNIDIELWTKEAPRACRNFIQLCLEGYFNNNIFFRIIKGFMIQTGDPTNTGKEGESIWGKEFMDEFHSRLRFNHRGIVAMANRNKSNTNGSQFFITMDKCQWLEKKHTIFGKVTGQTYFNALSISEIPTKDDYPITETLPMIIKVEVLLNPFIDIVPRSQTKKHIQAEDDKIIVSSLKEFKMKEKLKNSNLISFDEEDEAMNINIENNINKKDKFKIKPIHALVANDKKLVNKPVINKQEFDSNNKENDEVKNLKDKIKNLNQQNSKETELKHDLNLRDSEDSEESSESESEDETNENLNNLISKNRIENLLELDRKNEILQLKQEIMSIKKKMNNPDENESQKEIDNKYLTPLQQHQMKFLHLKKGRANAKEAVEKINKFKNKLRDSKNEDDNWMNNKLKFHVDSQKAYAINDTNEKILKGFDLSISMNK